MAVISSVANFWTNDLLRLWSNTGFDTSHWQLLHSQLSFHSSSPESSINHKVTIFIILDMLHTRLPNLF